MWLGGTLGEVGRERATDQIFVLKDLPDHGCRNPAG